MQQRVSCEADFLLDVLRLVSRADGGDASVWWSGGGGHGVRGRIRRGAGGSDSGLLDVTLTENREGHVGVSGGAETRPSPTPDPPTPHPPFPPSRHPRRYLASEVLRLFLPRFPARTSESLISDEPI